MVQYKAAPMITGAIKGTYHDRLYQQFRLESLPDGRWSHRPFFFHKIIQGLLPSYLQTYLNVGSEGVYLTHSTTQNKIKPTPTRIRVFENSFFPYCIKELSKHNNKIRNIKSVNKFKVTILNFIRHKWNLDFYMACMVFDSISSKIDEVLILFPEMRAIARAGTHVSLHMQFIT